MKTIFPALLILVVLIPSVSVFAQGDFDYLAIKGPGITGEINVTNPVLTGDYFAFADFTQGEVPPPADPGQGYEIVRVHVVDSKPLPYDQLHYYPYTGYVYYDGLVEGSSEHDEKWYAANPSANEPFRAVLAERARLNWIPFALLILILGGFFVAYRSKPRRSNA